MEVKEEDNQLPMARMMTITRASFWIYFAVCTILFICVLFTPRQPMADWVIPSAIAICIFADLSLEIVRQRQAASARLLLYICYGFEIVSALLFAIVVSGKLLPH